MPGAVDHESGRGAIALGEIAPKKLNPWVLCSGSGRRGVLEQTADSHLREHLGLDAAKNFGQVDPAGIGSTRHAPRVSPRMGIDGAAIRYILKKISLRDAPPAEIFEYSEMEIHVFQSRPELGEAAADLAANLIRAAIDERDQAFVVVATGNSQRDFLGALVRKPQIDWSKTVLFQLDEYVGLPQGHRASLSEFIRRNVLDHVAPAKAYLLDQWNAQQMGELVSQQVIDVAFVGIGENGHLAFNDPPADFDTEEPYIVVPLDQKCREQQVGEGWFERVEDVPATAVSMSIRQILKSREILCVVPERRKAEAVRDCLGGKVSPMHPASILQQHGHVTCFLDEESASLLKP
jgi:glucosamine-6-phosphate deaminase